MNRANTTAAGEARGAGSGINGRAPHQRRHAVPRSLGEALREAGVILDSPGPGSDTPSEEDYDENVRPSYKYSSQKQRQIQRREDQSQQPQKFEQEGDQQLLRKRKPLKVNKDILFELDTSLVRDGSGLRLYVENDKTLLELLEKSSASAKNPEQVGKQRRKFRDHLFTHQFSAFDPHNSPAANSPFHGFYTLFWLAVALFMLKISVNNWVMYGTPFGSNEIMKIMFRRDGEFGSAQSVSSERSKGIC